MQNNSIKTKGFYVLKQSIDKIILLKGYVLFSFFLLMIIAYVIFSLWNTLPLSESKYNQINKLMTSQARTHGLTQALVCKLTKEHVGTAQFTNAYYEKATHFITNHDWTLYKKKPAVRSCK